MNFLILHGFFSSITLFDCTEFGMKDDIKKEDEEQQLPQQPAAEPDNEWQAMQGDQSDQGSQAKGEDDRYGSYNRKRPYEDNRGYGYYEHREDKRYMFMLLIFTTGFMP